ncbi:hypothetical protein FSP39_022878 [Pinctada imbricata]|uniref:Opine dehydrogenase domain-containing protein n=1 Tax=Pinctada imbricata TaxID=66713 RepID=A0AA88XT28_PINIB|nr:hypothetical protein FSP39_022878 [Pinctada imbricata]
MAGPLKVCVCGGDKDAQALAGLSALCNDIETRVLALQEEEASKWAPELNLIIHERNGNTRDVKSKPRMVTSDPKEAVSGSDMVIIVVPAHAHGVYLEAVVPHLGKNTLIVGLPGRPGFEFQCSNLLGVGVYTVMSFETFPWESKVIEFGKKIEISHSKQFVTGAMTRGRGICRRPPLMSIQMMHGSEPLFRQARHFLEVTLSPYNFLNVALCYGYWKDWDNKPVTDVPMLYETVSKETAELIETCSNELLTLAEAIKGAKPSVDLSNVKDIRQWFVENYRHEFEDKKEIQDIIKSTKSFQGIEHLMKDSDGGKIPDFESMLSEDIPMGLAAIKGIAIIMETEVPKLSHLLEWGQSKLGKQYLVDGQLTGSDVDATRCPQKYGFNTLQEILDGKKEENPA